MFHKCHWYLKYHYLRLLCKSPANFSLIFSFFSCSYMCANGQKCLFFLKKLREGNIFYISLWDVFNESKVNTKNLIFPSQEGNMRSRREIWDLFLFFLNKKWWKKCSYKGKVGRVSRDAARSEKFKHRFSRNLYVVFDIFNYGTKLFFNFLIASQSTFY